jgi:hypothetical protein
MSNSAEIATNRNLHDVSDAIARHDCQHRLRYKATAVHFTMWPWAASGYPSARGAPQEAHRSLPVRWNHLRVAKFTCCRSDPVRPTRSWHEAARPRQQAYQH